MAPLGATQDAKTTNGSGELLPESAAIENHPAPLAAADMISRLAGIGVLLLGVVAAFLYLGAWSTPQNLKPGPSTSFSGWAASTRVSAATTQKASTSVDFPKATGRGAPLEGCRLPTRPRASDWPLFSGRRRSPYRWRSKQRARPGPSAFSARRQQWRTAMINLPVFPVKDEQAFYDNLVASEPDPNTQQPDPAQGAAFVAHFGAVLFRTLIVRDGLLSRMLPGWARAR